MVTGFLSLPTWTRNSRRDASCTCEGVGAEQAVQRLASQLSRRVRRLADRVPSKKLPTFLPPVFDTQQVFKGTSLFSEHKLLETPVGGNVLVMHTASPAGHRERSFHLTKFASPGAWILLSCRARCLLQRRRWTQNTRAGRRGRRERVHIQEPQALLQSAPRGEDRTRLPATPLKSQPSAM